MAVHCSECSFVNVEGANYCQKCGSYMGPDGPGEPTTATYRVGETGEIEAIDIEAVVDTEGAALVIRAGGGRVGESFVLQGERVTIGRDPDCGVFLDDVTVSRDHAILVRRAQEWSLDDCGSLNGSYVNRRRVDSSRLTDGDELQIGKYKLTFLAR
ncbi:MAG: FHA domain-containing protein [Actinomycetota bacterium]